MIRWHAPEKFRFRGGTAGTCAALLVAGLLLAFPVISSADVDTIWAATNSGGNFTNPANGLGAPDGAYAYSATNNSHTYSNFANPGWDGRIDSVFLLTKVYVSASQFNDYVTLTPGNTSVARTITTAAWNMREGAAAAGFETFDITGDKVSWAWTDFAAGTQIVVDNVKNQGPDGGDFYYDCFGFRIVFVPSLPVLSIDTVYQSSSNGSGEVTVQYDLSHVDLNVCKLTVEYSSDGSAWYQAWIGSSSEGSVDNTGVGGGTSTGQITGIATDVSNAVFVWDSDNAGNENGAFGGEDASVYLRIVPNDGVKDGQTVTSDAFIVDNQEPAGYGCLTPTDGTDWPGPQPTLASAEASDLSAISYYFDIDTLNSPFAGSHYQSSGWQEGNYNWTVSPLQTSAFYWWRVKARDSYGNEGAFAADTFNFQVSATRPNVIIDSVRQTSTDGAGEVTLYYGLTDPNTDVCKLTIEYSFDKSTWYQAWIKSSSAGDTGNTDVSSGTSSGQVSNIATDIYDQTLVWDSKNTGNENGAFSGEDASVWIRALPNDGANDGETVVSLGFALDNQAPTGYSCSSPANTATGVVLSPTLSAVTATDQSAVQYYFELATNSGFTTGVQQSGWQTATTWEPATGLNGNTTYYWHVRARDAYGNEGTYAASYSFTTSDGWVYPETGTIGTCTSPSLGDGVVYVGTGGTDDKLYCIDLTDGSLKWSVSIGADALAVSSAWDESAGKYAVYVAYSKTVSAYWDNGSSPSSRWSRDFGNPARNPSEVIPAPDRGSVYLAYNNTGRRMSNTTGADEAGWPTGGINASENSAPVVDNATVYFGNTGGTVYKYLVDGTASGNTATGGSAINTPLGMWNGVLYAAPADNFIYAVDASTISLTWTSPTLGAQTNTGVFSTGGGVLYVGAGSTLKQLADNGVNATVNWTYTAGGAVNSTPISNEDGTQIYFGCDDNGAYGITSAGADITGYPKTDAGNTLRGTPAVDPVTGIVVFTSTEGRVYGYAQQ